ncbi:hypothetical protein Tco_0444556 [Tanacetum coccineum]
MIGCEVMRTHASVEIEIILILGLPCCLSSSSVRCLESADEAQSPRAPVPLPEDPYEAIRQAYLDGTDTESEPFEDPVKTETPESPLTVAPPTSLPEKVAAMSESAFRKRFRSSYESAPSLSPLDLPSRKRYQDTSELVEDDEEDEEIEESLDSDSVSEDVKDEGPTAEDEDPAAGDEGLAAGDESPGIEVKSRVSDVVSRGSDDESRGIDDEGHSVESDGLGLGEDEEAVLEGQQRAVPIGSESALESERPERVSTSRQPILTTWTDPEDGMVYIDVPAYPPPVAPVQTLPSPEWTSGSLHISPSPSIVPSPISSPMTPLTEGLIRDHAIRFEELSPDLFKRSLEHEQERVAATFGALWRLVLALESWAGQTGAQRATLWHAISDTHGENRELRSQLVEERRVRLELAEIVESMRRGRESRGNV